jgi:hypothetical protein
MQSLCFLNRALRYTFVVRSNKMHTFFISDLIQLYYLRHVSSNQVFIPRETVLWYIIMLRGYMKNTIKPCTSLPGDENLVARNISNTIQLNLITYWKKVYFLAASTHVWCNVTNVLTAKIQLRQWIGQFCNTVSSDLATLGRMPPLPFCCQLKSKLFYIYIVSTCVKTK